MNAYDQVTTRDKLDTKEGRDEFVLESLRNKNYGREEFNEFVTRRYSDHDQGNLVSKLMDAYGE